MRGTVREVPVRGTVLRSTSYNEKEESSIPYSEEDRSPSSDYGCRELPMVERVCDGVQPVADPSGRLRVIACATALDAGYQSRLSASRILLGPPSEPSLPTLWIAVAGSRRPQTSPSS